MKTLLTLLERVARVESIVEQMDKRLNHMEAELIIEAITL